jgi:glutaredoxin-like protein
MVRRHLTGGVRRARRYEPHLTGKQTAAGVVALSMEQTPDQIALPEPADATNTAIAVYWRPGCGYCSALFRRLERNGVEHTRVNIWDDAAAAARVREATGGNETVPTVFVAEIPMVNPSVHQIMAAAMKWAPDAVPAGYEPPTPILGRLRRA